MSTPVFLPGNVHGQKSLVDYSPWGYKESDTTERLSTRVHTHTHTHTELLDTLVCERSKNHKALPLLYDRTPEPIVDLD